VSLFVSCLLTFAAVLSRYLLFVCNTIFFVIKSRKLVGVKLTSADSESNLRDRISNDDVVTDHCYTVNTQT